MINNRIRILILGDIVGAPGRAMVQKHLHRIKQEHSIDAVIINGENSGPRGKGITPRIMEFFKHLHVNVVTTGNHIWFQKEIYEYLDQHNDLLRPDNFPSKCPGSGVTTFKVHDITIGVINVQGRVFMRELVSDPFQSADSALTFLRSKTSIIVVDFHAETTAEKMALGFYLDGRVSVVVGTHTHVQTADERILPKGTAFITDLGMAGSLDSMIGMKKEPIITNMITQMPQRFEVETAGPYVLSGVWVEVDTKTGTATRIERIRIVDVELSVEEE